MRCGCPHCEAFMIHSEEHDNVCVCPECGYRCNACLGTGTVISKQDILNLKEIDWIQPNFESPINDEDELNM